MKETYRIELAYDTHEAEEFAGWLREQGHDAFIGDSTGTFIDNYHTDSARKYNTILRNLWDEYCRS